MGFLTDAERQNLQIEAMILHVVGDEYFTPEPARQVEHANFFVGRVLETDVAAVHAFKEVSNTRATLEFIARGESTFEAGAQALSREFSRFHGTSARDGAFFIFALRTDDPNTRLYSMIKYDYREAIEQAEDEDGQQRLRRIIHAFIDDKKAIQKSALIRVVDGQAEFDIAARDRSKAAPDIADYFAAFLDVERNRSDNELNQALVETLRLTLQESKDVLPEKDVARAMHTAKATLRDRQEIDEQAIVEAVLAAAGHPQDEEIRGLLRTRTAQKLRKKKLTGLVFPPNRQILRKPPMRKLVTTEGVTVTYPDEADAVTVRRERNPNGGGEVITITTDRIVEDSVVRDPTR
jgi:hypothetical protein